MRINHRVGNRSLMMKCGEGKTKPDDVKSKGGKSFLMILKRREGKTKLDDVESKSGKPLPDDVEMQERNSKLNED